jgi:CSLREA domain-containing protein
MMRATNDPLRLVRRAASALLSLGLLAALMGTPAWAANLLVNTVNDADNGGDGACSLREAITAANNNANYHECTGTSYGNDTITFSVSGTITLGATLPP